MSLSAAKLKASKRSSVFCVCLFSPGVLCVFKRCTESKRRESSHRKKPLVVAAKHRKLWELGEIS